MIVVFIVILLVVTAVVLAWSLVLGALLSALLPFSLFEGSLLGLFSSAVAGYFLTKMLPKSPDFDWDELDFGARDIPEDKFFAPDESVTWGRQAQYEIANEVLRQLKMLGNTGQMSDEQIEALAIRLSEPAVEVLKRKSPRTTNFDITVTQLRKQLESMDQQPYDDDIMRAAVKGINLVANSGPGEKVIRLKLWQKVMLDDDLLD